MRFIRSVILSGLSSAALLVSQAALAQAPAPAEFVTKATQAGMTEIAVARIALGKSKADDVQTFAKQMIKDHSAAQTELAAIAQRQNLAVPAQLDADNQAVVAKFKRQPASAFDAAYAKQMVADHEEAVALFKSEAAGVKADAELAAFAQKTLPTLESHKTMADALAAAHS